MIVYKYKHSDILRLYPITAVRLLQMIGEEVDHPPIDQAQRDSTVAALKKCAESLLPDPELKLLSPSELLDSATNRVSKADLKSLESMSLAAKRLGDITIELKSRTDAESAIVHEQVLAMNKEMKTKTIELLVS